MIRNVVSVASILLWLSLEAFAVPTTPAGLTIPLRMRSPSTVRDLDELGLRAKTQRDAAIVKYSTPDRRRSTGFNLIVDQDYDSGYYGSLAIGTPLTSFDVFLDTGSSDLWVVGSGCGSSCNGLPLFNPPSSSSFKNTSTSFSIQYGSGSAIGYVAQDVVQMAGFSVSNQGFAVVNALSSGLLSAPVSGLLGLAWQTISSSGAMPFWQTLASSGSMDSALFAVQLRRYSNASNPSQLEPGGELTIGYTNSSLYSGSIEYINIPGTPSYWYLPLQSLTVQGNSIPIGSGTNAAIDTGTTNIGGPASAVQAIYAQVPGSSLASGQWAGYYQFPCSTSVTVTFSFGGQTWTMSPNDFTYIQISSSKCIGSIFELDSTTGGGSAPFSWIIGDAFLKNVYSVFRYNPPSVGFAALSSVAIAQNGVDGAAPSPTIGTASATVTNANGAMSRTRPALGHGMVAGMVGLLMTMTWAL